MPDWTAEPYVRVFVTFPDDHPDVWDDDQALAWWLRLLVAADRAFPGSPEFPRRLPPEVEARLVAAEVIRPAEGSRYRVAGLAKLRAAGVRDLSVAGGRARARGPRDPVTGRLLPTRDASPLDQPGGPEPTTQPPLAQRAGPTNGAKAPSRATQPAGDQPAGTQGSSQQNRPDDLDEGPSQAPSSREGRPLRARAKPAFDGRCDDPAAHADSQRWSPGIGWKCLVCEAARRDTEPTFRERVPWPAVPQEDDDERPF